MSNRDIMTIPMVSARLQNQMYEYGKQFMSTSKPFILDFSTEAFRNISHKISLFYKSIWLRTAKRQCVKASMRQGLGPSVKVKRGPSRLHPQTHHSRRRSRWASQRRDRHQSSHNQHSQHHEAHHPRTRPQSSP